jgi:translocation protein SEC63
MLNICLSHNWLKTTLAIVKLQAALAQALPPTASPLTQLPGISHEDAFELEVVKGAEGKKWAEKAVKKGLLEGDAKTVAEHWPRLEITDAEFKGELFAMC